MTPAGVYVAVMGAYLRPVAVTFNHHLALRLGRMLARETEEPIWTDSLDTDGHVIPEWVLR